MNVLIYICLQKLMIILTFKHGKSCWLVLKCIHDLQEKRHTKQTINKKQKTKKLKEKNYKKNKYL